MSLHSSDDPSDGAGRARGPHRVDPAVVPVYRSRDLFHDGNRVHIEHGAGTYVLQITRQGKLILTK